MSLFEDASLVVTPNGRKAGKIYSIKPTDGSGDLSVVRATTATRVNSSGLIQSVSANVPRLDYSNGSCPSILVEPQRTNLLLRSEEFDNAYWNKLASTISTNSITSPNNTLTADKLIEDTSASAHRFISTAIPNTSGVTYTASIFVKAAERNFAFVRFNNSGGDIVSGNVNLTNGNVTQTLAGTISTVAFPNGWYRIIFSGVSTSTSSGFIEVRTSNSATYANYTGDGASGIYLWGAQLEAGSNATSYIPTVASAVTRNADVISKTGISDLIGQTQGTIFIDLDWSGNLTLPSRLFQINNGTSSSDIFLNITSTNGNCQLFINNVGQPNPLLPNISVIKKFILVYTNNSLKMFVNGSLVFDSIQLISFALLDRLNIGSSNIASDRVANMRVNNFMIFKTALTNEQCLNLTSL